MTSSWKPKSEKRIGEVKTTPTTAIVVREVTDENNNVNIDIRFYVKSQNFDGFGRGVFFPKEKLDEVISLLQRVKSEG